MNLTPFFVMLTKEASLAIVFRRYFFRQHDKNASLKYSRLFVIEYLPHEYWY